MSGLNSLEMSSLLGQREAMTIELPEKDRIEKRQRDRDVAKEVQGVLDGKRSNAEAARLLDWRV